MKSKKLFAEITIYSDSGEFLTPRRVQLLQAIKEHGSILQASKQISMSYRNAWLCVQDMNQTMNLKLVDSNNHKGSFLTNEGKFIIDMYHGIQKSCAYGISYMSDNSRKNKKESYEY